MNQDVGNYGFGCVLMKSHLLKLYQESLRAKDDSGAMGGRHVGVASLDNHLFLRLVGFFFSVFYHYLSQFTGIRNLPHDYVAISFCSHKPVQKPVWYDHRADKCP
jgi:hypothetical protein